MIADCTGNVLYSMETKLYIVPTPVGNLDDMTFRAVKVLEEVDFILAEDTRTAGILLKHFGISKKTTAYHKFNEHRILPVVLNRLLSGMSAALVSDAGTPGISDPGFLIVRRCLQEGIGVECLPGATACIPALVDSGLPADRFCFEGFLPVKKGRNTRLNFLAEETRTMIFYESPHRVVRTLHDFSVTFGPDREISVSRELSKIHEETVHGTIQSVSAHFEEVPPKGEFVMVVAGKQSRKKGADSDEFGENENF